MSGPQSPHVTEPISTELMPFRRNVDYFLSWYIAETLPEDIEVETNEKMLECATADNPTPYIAPPAFPEDIKLIDRVRQDIRLDENGKQICYEPQRHEGTGVDSDEAQYESYLLKIPEALGKLKGSSMAYVVDFGWQLIEKRFAMEDAESLGLQTQSGPS